MGNGNGNERKEPEFTADHFRQFADIYQGIVEDNPLILLEPGTQARILEVFRRVQVKLDYYEREELRRHG